MLEIVALPCVTLQLPKPVKGTLADKVAFEEQTDCERPADAIAGDWLRVMNIIELLAKQTPFIMFHFKL